MIAPMRKVAAIAAAQDADALGVDAEEEKKNGWSISMGKVRTFSKLHKAGGRGAGGRIARAVGAADAPGTNARRIG